MRDLPLVGLVLGEDAEDREHASTVESLRQALGRDPRIYSSRKLPSGDCSQLPSVADLQGALLKLHEASDAEWVLCANAGDDLSPELGDALSRTSSADQDAGLIYWDEDLRQNGQRAEPWIKPDWDETLFARLGNLAGASIMRLEKALEVANGMSSLPLSREAVDRLAVEVARRSDLVSHIPLILTHRAQRNAVRDDASKWPEPNVPIWPSVSVLVPTRDRPDLLRSCLQGIEGTAYPGSLQLVIIDNGTVDGEALRLIEDAAGKGARVIRDSGPFNFSRLNNEGAQAASGEFLCFLNNDVEPLNPSWLKRLVSWAIDPQVGAVGAMLLYPSGRIQHAGVAIGLGGAAGHVQKGVRPSDNAFWTWHRVTRRVSAVTAAVMVIERGRFNEVGGFDESNFPVAFNDVDLCLRLDRAGYRNLYVAEAKLLHRESESRGNDSSRANAPRFASELAALQNRWGTVNFTDPYHSSLFSKVVERCALVP